MSVNSDASKRRLNTLTNLLKKVDNRMASSRIQSLTPYNEKETEKKENNKLQRSIEILIEISKKKVMNDIPIVVLLNKRDLFEDLLKDFPFNSYDPACPREESRNSIDCIKFLKNKVEKQFGNPKRK